jgi:LPXTG-site transpeptidase (sortase) family protein
MRGPKTVKVWCNQVGLRIAASALFALGGLFLLGGGLYASYVALQNWVIHQDQFLALSGSAPLSVPAMTPTATPTPTSTPLPTPTVTPTPTPPPKPVHIDIPAIYVRSPIVPVAQVTDSQTGLTDWDIGSLFRSGRRDLVGHLEGTALPGQPGNAVLGGHNYGYGHNGVFVSLGRLKDRDRITVVNEGGESLVYEVVSVERIPWRRKTLEELARHLDYLAPTGEERLTLMSCGGANFEPFPERVYVVAKPIR